MLKVSEGASWSARSLEICAASLRIWDAKRALGLENIYFFYGIFIDSVVNKKSAGNNKIKANLIIVVSGSGQVKVFMLLD